MTVQDKGKLRAIAKMVMHSGLPVPRLLRPLIRLAYRLCRAAVAGGRFAYGALIVSPVFRSIAEVGSGLRIERIPFMQGRGAIRVGSEAYISGKIAIAFGNRHCAMPELTIGDRCFIGNMCFFGVARSVRIGNDCLLAANVSIRDYDGHSLDPAKRRRREPADADDVNPVTIEDDVWIGNGALILKGVTVGRGSVIGAHAVVTGDVPPFTVVAGNPARMVKDLPSDLRENDAR